MSRLLRPLAVALAVLVILAAGIWLGGHPSGLPDPVAKALVDKQTRIVAEALDTIDDNYYVKPRRDTLADDAIWGMVHKLRQHDQFSNYLTKKEYAAFGRSQREQFTGIGVIVSRSRLGLRVQRVYDRSPAKLAGVRAGDVIVRAGGRALKGMTLREASSHVTGKAGTFVVIALKRGKRTLQLRVERKTLSAGFTTSKLVRRDSEKVGVVRLSQFGPGAHADLITSLERLGHRGATRYVLDLRDNPGGLVSEARLVASVFLKDGPIVSTRGRTVKSQTLTATGKPLLPKAPLVVLVNRDSASASEIVAGALQDRHRAEIVGTRTYGKGVFQQIIELSNGGALDLTAGEYFTPDGRNLGGGGTQRGSGISPDVRASDDTKTRADEALDRAVAVVASERA